MKMPIFNFRENFRNTEKKNFVIAIASFVAVYTKAVLTSETNAFFFDYFFPYLRICDHSLAQNKTKESPTIVQHEKIRIPQQKYQ